MAIGPEESSYEIPQSRGMPPVVRWLLGVGVVVIFFMGALSIGYSHEFHIWPAADVSRIPVTGKF